MDQDQVLWYCSDRVRDQLEDAFRARYSEPFYGLFWVFNKEKGVYGAHRTLATGLVASGPMKYPIEIEEQPVAIPLRTLMELIDRSRTINWKISAQSPNLWVTPKEAEEIRTQIQAWANSF